MMIMMMCFLKFKERDSPFHYSLTRQRQQRSSSRTNLEPDLRWRLGRNGKSDDTVVMMRGWWGWRRLEWSKQKGDGWLWCSLTGWRTKDFLSSAVATCLYNATPILHWDKTRCIVFQLRLDWTCYSALCIALKPMQDHWCFLHSLSMDQTFLSCCRCLCSNTNILGFCSYISI